MFMMVGLPAPPALLAFASAAAAALAAAKSGSGTAEKPPLAAGATRRNCG
jgi:hypothetical protein